MLFRSSVKSHLTTLLRKRGTYTFCVFCPDQRRKHQTQHPHPKLISNLHTYRFSYSVATALFSYNHCPVFQGRQCEGDYPVLLRKCQFLQSSSVYVRRCHPQFIHFGGQVHLQGRFRDQGRFGHGAVHVPPAKAVRQIGRASCRERVFRAV